MAPPCSVPKFLTGSIPARWYGLRVPLRVSIVVGFLLCIYLVYHARPTHHHDPFGEQDTVVVHGKTVSSRLKPTYPLVPFPNSPMRACPTTETETATDLEECAHRRNPWLAAVICAMDDFEHRMRIRSTWMRLFRDVPFDGRFVVSNPGPRWTEAVAMENRTFGDLIVLEHLHEDDVTANTVKTLEFYRWLVKSGKKYEFVSKMDTDLWLNARGFWDRFLVPRMTAVDNVDGGNQSIGTETVWKSTVSRTIIGELYYSRKQRLVFPHGGMYTTTWDLLEQLVSLQGKHHVVTGEDMAVSLLLRKGNQKANFVNFRGSEKFDYDDADSRGDTAWARTGTHPDATQHALTGFYPIAVHQLKKERDWFKVAGCFDEGGIKEAPPKDEGKKGRAPPLSVRWFDFWYRLGMTRRYETRFETIPEALWAREGGNWTCGGVWNMGASREGYSGEALGSG